MAIRTIGVRAAAAVLVCVGCVSPDEPVTPAGSDAAASPAARLLEAGTYQVDTTLRISKSGVVLRGSGSGTDGPRRHAVLVRRALTQDWIGGEPGLLTPTHPR